MDELQALKDQLHKQIDDCQDEERLRAAADDLNPEYADWNALPTHVQEGILRGLEDTKAGRVMSWEDFLKERDARRAARLAVKGNA